MLIAPGTKKEKRRFRFFWDGKQIYEPNDMTRYMNPLFLKVIKPWLQDDVLPFVQNWPTKIDNSTP